MAMETINLGKPSEKQFEFLRASTKYVGFGGARGGGKSWAVRVKAIISALKYPSIKILIVRKTLDELKMNHINTMIPLLYKVAKYNVQSKCFKFQNGSTIQFTYCATDADLVHIQGAEFDLIFIDEATNLSEFQLRAISACLRGTNDFPKRIYYTFNPGGQGHQYIKRIFIDKKYIGSEKAEDYTFIQSLVTDNYALMKSDPGYVELLDTLPEKLKKAWRYGCWDVFDGMFFEEFSDNPEGYDTRKYTHVIRPFEIPGTWTIYRSFDWGYAKPFSCGWWAIDHDGRMYRILELYGCTREPNTGVKWTADQVFSEIHRIETDHRWLSGKNIIGIADPAIFQHDGGESIADIADKHSVYFNRASNKRLPGWVQVHNRLKFDDEGIPMMYVFDTCKAFIRTMPLLQYSATMPEDLDTTGEDHVADEVRYMAMERPIIPKLTKNERAIQDDPLDLLENKRLYENYASTKIL